MAYKKRKCKNPKCVTLLHKNHEGDYCYVCEGLYLEQGKEMPPHRRVLALWVASCSNKNDCDECTVGEWCFNIATISKNWSQLRWEEHIEHERIKDGG